MSVLRVFVLSTRIEDQEATRSASRLINDLQAVGVEVVTDNEEAIPGAQFPPFLERELPRCQHLLLLQTLVALSSPRVQQALTMARLLATQQRMHPVLYLCLEPFTNTTNTLAFLASAQAGGDDADTVYSDLKVYAV